MENGKKRVFWPVRMEVKLIRIKKNYVQQVTYGHYLHVETIPVWIVRLHLEIFSSEPGAPKWYFEKMYFPNLKNNKIELNYMF
jgi:hypothetical protein